VNFWIDVLPSVVAAIFIWWGATGIIIYLCGRRAWRPWVFGVVTLAQPFAFWQMVATRDSHDVGGVFAQFFWAIIIWSWIETSYYSGLIVGRKNIPEIEPGTPTSLRFRRAVAANLYHELMIIGLSIAVIIVGWGGSNETGLWTFMILHWTHQSAKINIFLGINNLTTDYLPDNLKYMAQYFTQKPLNSFFPFSATISTIIATALFISAAQTNTAGEQVGQALLFVLMVAAVIEHWWLVTPVPSKAWDWALKSRKADEQQQLPTIQVVCGYLGSGKTTLIRHLLPQFDERVAVLVNDFGAVGIDAELIRGDNAAGMVVELPGGCVCCTLQKNLSGQIINLLETFKPERVIIEPSGVAGIEEIIKALASPRLVKRVANVEVVAVIEAPRLLASGGLPEFVVTQIKAAGAIVISKTDLVQPGEVGRVGKVVSALNHKARVITAINGQVALNELFEAKPELLSEEHEQHLHDEEEGGLISFGKEYTGEFDPQALRDLFADLRDGHYGPVIRAKGIFHARGGGRLAWDLASGNIIERILTPPLPGELPGGRFMAIAEDLTSEQLHERLQGCIIPAVSL